jgi:hypothetical protein
MKIVIHNHDIGTDITTWADLYQLGCSNGTTIVDERSRPDFQPGAMPDRQLKRDNRRNEPYPLTDNKLAIIRNHRTAPQTYSWPYFSTTQIPACAQHGQNVAHNIS